MSSEDQLYKDILKLNVPVLRRELERNALPATGRKAELIQRLYKFTKREFITSRGGSPEDSVRGEKSPDKNESISKTPSRIPRLLPNVEEINKSVRSRLDTTSLRSREHSGQTIQTGQLSNNGQPRLKASSDELKYDTDHREYEFAGHVGDNGHGGNSDHDNIVQEINEMKILMKTQSNMVYQMEKDMDLKINSWTKKILEAVQHKALVTADTSSDDISNSNEMEKLRRKYKFYGSAIEIILLEISEFNHGEVSKAEMENSLHRLNEKEEQCGSIVQEIITLQTDESIVDKEIRVWTEFQQRILRASRKVGRFISQLNKDEEAEQRSIEDRTPLKECRESNSSSNLKLPKFTLQEFHGNMIEWVSWWDQFKSCIHENNALSEREKFNYLRVYVKGSARKVIEYIEVTSPNYLKAIDALKKRYGRQRLVVEHLVESILNIEKRERVTAQSLRYLYDTLVNRYHTLEQYEPNLEMCHRILVPIFQNKLPNDIRRKWEASSSPKTEVTKDEKVSSSERVEATVKSHVGVLNGIVKADSENKMRLLPTAKAKLIQNGTETDVRILIDSGSDHSYIKQDIADSLGMQSEGPSKLMAIHMHGGQSRTIKVRNFKFTLTALDGSKSADVSAWAVDKVCTPLEAVPVDISKYRYLKGLKLADSYPRQTANIDILLGSDQWGQILRSGLKKRDASSPIETNSIFGWMISGNVDVGSEYHPSNRAMTNCATVRTIEEELNLDLKRFWQLKSLGIDESDKRLTKDEESAMQQFKDSLVYDGERYEVALPWREDCTGLEDNRHQAVSRLVKIEKRLQYDKEKASMYQDAINQYLKDGHAREIDKTDSNSETKINYLPHHPVFRTDKVTTKCRVVFDASSKNKNGVSLNDCLLPGPNKNGVSLNDCLLPGPVLQPNLVSIIIRFRLHRVALMADIRKMFLQIKLAKQDQNVHRFMWRDFITKIEPKTYCMTRLTCGDVSSPFEAIATVQHHAEVNKESFPEASETIKENMYVDDCLTGAEDDKSAFQLYEEATEMMKSGGFEVVKWASNSKDVLVRIPKDQRATKNVIEIESEGDPLKVLGIS
eukprot:Seg1359.14 transcript_id=Seg1359.14/GoldUCD/mRNA.D3Y31 product="hypothetical protein" protein_id=Seg1359.14/GoldUCD/D3Y31